MIRVAPRDEVMVRFAAFVFFDRPPDQSLQGPSCRPVQFQIPFPAVAKTLGTSKAWVRDHATRRDPRIPCVRLGCKRALLRFRPEDVEAFIDKHLICTEEYA